MKLIKKGPFADLRDPIQFLKVFGAKENSHILVSFLNDMLENEGNDVIESVVETLKTSEDPMIAAKRQSILDVLCKKKSGDYSIAQVIVASSEPPNFQRNIAEYACATYLMEAKSGRKYELITKVNCVAMLDFILLPNNPDAKTDFAVIAKTPTGQVLKPLKITCIELPKFKAKLDAIKSAYSE